MQSNNVTRQVNLNMTKIGGKCQNWKHSNATFFGIFKHFENHSKYLLRDNLTNYYSFHNFQLGHIFVMLQHLKDKRVNRSMTYEAKPFWKSTENWNFYGTHNKALGMHTVSKHIFLFKNTAGQLFEFLAPKLLSNF